MADGVEVINIQAVTVRLIRRVPMETNSREDGSREISLNVRLLRDISVIVAARKV